MHESQLDEMCEWELYEPVKGQLYSLGTEYRGKGDGYYWSELFSSGSICNHPENERLLYRRPARKPLDIDLPYLLKKSAACSPSTQAAVLSLKAKFADEVGRLIEADKKGGAA